VNARSLQDDLLSIPGVEGAEVEGSDDKPAGLRIRIAEGADQRAVGGAIRRVLTSHGLGTDTRLPGEVDAVEGASEVAAASDPGVEATGVVADTEVGSRTVVAVAEADEVIDLTQPAEGAESAAAASSEDEASTVEPVVTAVPGAEPTSTTDASTADQRRAAPAPWSAVPRLASVSVEEGRDGIVVIVTAGDGTSVRRAAASSEGGVESAVVRATATLAQPHAPEATVIEIDDRRVEGVDIVMIVLDVDGGLASGSAVVGAGRAFALARATWAALTM
jgi:hypothetical protein